MRSSVDNVNQAMCACSDIWKVCMKWLLTFIKFESGGKFVIIDKDFIFQLIDKRSCQRVKSLKYDYNTNESLRLEIFFIPSKLAMWQKTRAPPCHFYMSVG